MEGIKACYPNPDPWETVFGGQCLVARHSPVGMETPDGLEFSFFDEQGEIIGAEDFSCYQSLAHLDRRAAHFWQLYRERQNFSLNLRFAITTSPAKFIAKKKENRMWKWEDTNFPREETEFSSSFTINETYIEEFHNSDGSLDVSFHFEDMEGYPTEVPIPAGMRADYDALKNEVAQECYPLESGRSVCFQIFEGANVLKYTCLDSEERKYRWGTYGAMEWNVESLQRDCE